MGKTLRMAVLGVAGLVLTIGPSCAGAEEGRVGQSYEGRLQQGDTTYPSGEFVDYYEVSGRAGESVTVTMESSEIDSYLGLHPPTGDPVGNDDGGGGRNARISVTFPVDGVYRFGATTYSPGESGGYTLRIEGGISGGAAIVSEAAEARRIVVEGTLGEGDRQLRDTNEFYDHHFFDGRAGDRLVIYTISEVDTYLIVDAPGQEGQLDNDDISETDRNARIEHTLTRDGECEVMVTTAAAGQAGPYTLVIEGATPYTGGERYEGSLEEGDSQLTSGEYRDEYSFFARAGETVQVTMRSFELNSYVMVVPPEGAGAQAENDDGEPAWRDARVSLTAPAEGNYRIYATTFKPGETGRYTLFIRRPTGESTQTAPTGGPQVFRGELATGDAQMPTGELYDSYSIDVTAGQEVTVSMNSTTMDPFLILVPPEGEQVQNDDISESDRNARISLRSSAAGTLRIVATSFAAGQTGAYEIRISGATDRISQNSSAAVTTNRTYWAIICGISDYAGEPGLGNLEACREDAEKLAGGLIYDGLLRPNNLRLLVDGEVTPDGVRAAFRDLAPRIGPDDIFLFFYSGHGNREETGALAEPDRMDEYICLRSGPISDDEMNDLFGMLQAKISVLCLDSCFSGGFARDVISCPRRLGLFASEEDCTSQVAREFKAGGYMSYFFRRALRGEADANGNRMITVGELCKFLDDEFKKVEVPAVDSRRNPHYQRMVIERGGVRVDEELARVAEPE